MSASVIARLKHKIVDAEAEEERLLSHLRTLRGRIDGLRQALALIQSESDDAAESSGVEYAPDGKRARTGRLPNPDTNPRWRFILGLVNAAPPSGVSVDTVVKETEKTGHTLTSNVARSYLSIAAAQGIIRRVSVGHYRGKDTDGPNVETSGPSYDLTGDVGLPENAPSQGAPDGSTPSSSTTAYPQLRLAAR